MVREGIRSGDFRSDLDPRLATLTILNAANGVSSWYPKEGFSIEKIGGELITLILQGSSRSRMGGNPPVRRADFLIDL